MKSSTFEINDRSDLLALQSECPSCGENHLNGIPYAFAECKKCKIKYRTRFKQDMYSMFARRIDDYLAWNDSLTIIILEKHYPSLLHLQNNYIRFNCWEVSDITKSHSIYRLCKSCGTCRNCVTCICGKTFKADHTKRKLKCPDCKSEELKKAFINLHENEKACPHCKNPIIPTKTDRKTSCHKCGSEKLSEERNTIKFSLTITRKKGYFIDNA